MRNILHRNIQKIGYVFMIILSSCSLPRYYSCPNDCVYLLADYSDTIETWSSHDELHHQMIGVADINALYLSWEVRQAYLQTVKNQLCPEPEAINKLTQIHLNRFEHDNEFILGLYCHNKEWNKLTGESPIWSIQLQSDTGKTVKPKLIEKVTIRPDESWMFLDKFTHGREVYRVVFPKQDTEGNELICRNTRCFRLIGSSFLGSLILDWKMGPIPQDLQ